MPSLASEFINSRRFKQLTDIRNIGLYIFALIVMAITWSGIKTVQNNYELQKQISVLNQQNAVLELENSNTSLQNKYLQTDQYQDLAARQNLGLAAPGEKVLLVPKSVAMKYIDPNIFKETSQMTANKVDNRSNYVKNLEDWRDFLLGRKLFSE
jgi:cell division protein FtsB